MADEFEQINPSPGNPEPSPGFESPPTSPDYEQHEYRNKAVINQKGGTVEINNSTDREELKLSQYSGSNIALTNVVNSELATNNKQVQVNNDSFESVGSDKNVYVGKDKVERVGENTYILRGFENNTQLAAFNGWKNNFKGIADNNSQFRMLRGGFSFPNGVQTEKEIAPDGNDDTHWHLGRSNNPTINPINANRKLVLNNTVEGEDNDPELIAPTADEVADGSGGVAIAPITQEAGFPTDQWTSNNEFGSQAPGVIQFGSKWSPATEGGRWNPNPIFVSQGELTKQQQDIIAIQNTLNDYELAMGNGGDEITFVKRHKIETIGAATNNYPSTRIDPKGRSQPLGIDVGENTSYENMDYISHVEEVDNDMAFPAGNYTLNVGNRYNVLVGSGGLQLKTSGSVEMGGAVTKIAGAQVTIQASSETEEGTYNGTAGGGTVHIGSDGAVAIQGQKSVSLRSNRQVLVSPSLGVKRNLKVGGGTYIEGELYVHHITAPMVPKSVNTSGELLGKFNTDCNRVLKVAEARLDIRKLKEQLDWVEQDDARRQAEADAEAGGHPMVPGGEDKEKARERVANEERVKNENAFNDLVGEPGPFEEAGKIDVDVVDNDGVKILNPDDVMFKHGQEGHDEFWVNRRALREWVQDGNKEEDFIPPVDFDPREEADPGDDYLCWYPVFALRDPDIIKMDGHTHEYEGLPIRSMASNADVRKIAMCEYINRDDRISHARKASDGETPDGHGPISTGGIREGCTTAYPTTQPPTTPDPSTIICPEIPDCSCDETTQPPTTDPPGLTDDPIDPGTDTYRSDITIENEDYKYPDDSRLWDGNSGHNDQLLENLSDPENWLELGDPYWINPGWSSNDDLEGLPLNSMPSLVKDEDGYYVNILPQDEDGYYDPTWESDDAGNFGKDPYRAPMQILRESWDNINRARRNQNEKWAEEGNGNRYQLIVFPEIPDPRTAMFPEGEWENTTYFRSGVKWPGPWPAIPGGPNNETAGIWGPWAPEFGTPLGVRTGGLPRCITKDKGKCPVDSLTKPW